MRGPSARFQHWIEESPYLLTLGIMLLCAPLLVAACWLGVARWADDEYGQLMARANQALDQRQQQLAQDFDVSLNQLIGLPEYLSGEPRLLNALARPNDPLATTTASRLLSNSARFWVVELVYLMDAKGQVLAANNFETPQTVVGKNFGDRDYFKLALAGQPSHQFAVGRVTGVPGLYFSYPVRSAGKVIGVVTVKADMAQIGQRIRLSGCLVVDDLGVVVLADQRDYLFHALPGSPVLKAGNDARQRVYGRTDFPQLHLEPAGRARQPKVEMLGPRDNLVLRRQLPIAEEGLTVHVMEDLDGLAVIDGQRQWLFIAVSTGSVVVVWALVMTTLFVLRAGAYRRHVQRANQDLRQLNSQLKQQAESDFLTGSMNRRRFSEALAQEIGRSHRQKYPLAIAMFDLDHFKRVNDTHGHAVGDKVLQRFAELVRQHIRVSDSFARLGGEEFALLMPDADQTFATLALERMRKLVADAVVELPDGAALRFTVSVGATALAPADDADSFLRRADDALYAAKSQGRDRVVFAPA